MFLSSTAVKDLVIVFSDWLVVPMEKIGCMKKTESWNTSVGLLKHKLPENSYTHFRFAPMQATCYLKGACREQVCEDWGKGLLDLVLIKKKLCFFFSNTFFCEGGFRKWLTEKVFLKQKAGSLLGVVELISYKILFNLLLVFSIDS